MAELGKIESFDGFPLYFDGTRYRIPDPNLCSILGKVVPYGTPLSVVDEDIARKLELLVGKKVNIRGKIQGWLHDWYPASVITGIEVVEIEEAK